jgi:hypothetical protein
MADRLIERFGVQLEMTFDCSGSEKMKIVARLVRKIVAWLTEMVVIAV